MILRMRIEASFKLFDGLDSMDDLSPTVCFIKENARWIRPKDPFIREKFTKLRPAAKRRVPRKVAVRSPDSRTQKGPLQKSKRATHPIG
jgi:hypothetical protein